MPIPKAILLDLGGVVFQSTGVSNQVINWSVISGLNHRFGHAFNIGEDVFPAFMEAYNSATNQSLSGPAFLAAVFDTLEFNLKLVNFLKSIAEIIIVSDNYRENIAYISKRFEFNSWASQQYYSFDYRMEKADPRFFKALLKDIAYATEDLLFIDDSPNKLESAAQHQIQGIHFLNNDQLIAAVKSYVAK